MQGAGYFTPQAMWITRIAIDRSSHDLEQRKLTPKEDYPIIIDYLGSASPQYLDIDGKTGEMSRNPYRHKQP